MCRCPAVSLILDKLECTHQHSNINARTTGSIPQKSNWLWVTESGLRTSVFSRMISLSPHANITAIIISQENHLYTHQRCFKYDAHRYRQIFHCVYPGRVSRITGEDAYDIVFDDGDKEAQKKRKDIFGQVPVNMTQMWKWQREISLGVWEHFDEVTQAKIWMQYHKCTREINSRCIVLETSVGT